MGAGLVGPESRAASFTTTLEPDTIAVGDAAALKFIFEGSGQIQLSQLPNIPGLVVSGPEQRRTASPVKGQRRETMSVTYYLRPTQTNVFNIPSMSARIGTETFRSPPLRLKAVNATQSGNAQSLALLRLVVPREQLYVGENVVVELQLLLNRTVSNISEFDMPEFSGSGWIAGQPMQGQKRQVRLHGQIMTVIPIRIPLTPLSSGTLTLGPINSSVVVQIPAQRRSNDPFGGFGLFQRTAPRRVPLSLPAHAIEVRPLPTDDVPDSFSGSIGQFELSVSAGPTNVTVGDPVTIRVQISGTGNMGSISLSEPLVTGDFKTYEPEAKLDTTDDFGFVGMKTVEQIVIPENTEVREIPPIEFSFFEPTSGTYRTLTHPSTPLLVRPAGSRPPPTVAAGTDTQPADAGPEDIVHIKQRLDEPPTGQSGQTIGARFYALNTVPLFAWIGAVAWRKRAETLGRNPRLRRKQEVKRIVATGLNELETLSNASESEKFFATVFRLLQEKVGLVLDQPASGITESVVDEKLAPLGVPEATLKTLHELFQSCNVARYAPTRDPQELTALIPTLTRVLRELEKVCR